MLNAGRECTYKKDGTIGFDCGHCFDYPGGVGKDAIFRDFPYVLSVIHKTIDNINDLR
jgi:hypothetical protein